MINYRFLAISAGCFLFFSFLHALSDYTNVSLIVTDQEQVFWSYYAHKFYNWGFWLITSVLLFRKVDLVQLLSFGKKSFIQFSLRMGMLVILCVSFAAIRVIWLNPNLGPGSFLQLFLHFSLTFAFLCVIATSLSLAITISVLIHQNSVDFEDSFERLRKEKNRLLERLKEKESPLERIAIKIGKKSKILNTEDIKWFEADDYYVKIHTTDSTYIHRITLKKLEKKLGDKFIRLHRSSIVNVDYLHSIENNGNTIVAILKDGTQLDIAKSRYKAVKGAFN